MPSNLLLEAGFWGLPPDSVGRDPRDIPPFLADLLEKERLGASRIRIWLSASRFGILLEGVPATQAEMTGEIRGPKAAQAYDFNKVPTPAAAGFAASQGVAVKDLLIKDVDGEPYVFARKLVPGAPLAGLLPRLIPMLLGAPAWKAPPWLPDGILPQPPAYVCLLLDDKLPPLAVEGVTVGRETGWREGLTFRKVPLARAEDFPKQVAEWGGQSLPADRLKLLETQLQALSPPPATVRKDRELFDRVAFTLENPVAFLLPIKADLASVPKPLALEMLGLEPEYLPLESAKGELVPDLLIGIAPGLVPGTAELAVRATEIQKRLARMQKGWAADMQKPLSERVTELKALPAPDGIGSLYDHALRVARRAAHLNRLLDWKVPEPTIEKGVMFFSAGKALQLQTCFPGLEGQLIPLIAEAQGLDPDLVTILKDLGPACDPKAPLPTLPGAVLILLADLLNRTLSGNGAREAATERALHLLWTRQIRLDLGKVFSLPEDSGGFDPTPWLALTFRRLQKEGITREKGEWILRPGECDPVAIAGALRTWPGGPPPRSEAMADLARRLGFRLQQVKIGALKLGAAAETFPTLDARVQAMEAVPPGDHPALFARLLEAEGEIEAALASLPPVLDDHSSSLAGLLRLLQRVEAQLARFPFPGSGRSRVPNPNTPTSPERSDNRPPPPGENPHPS
ncbi:MAG: glycine--tRNA ligase subunit beta [Candidatus Riflebacteria bacterium]|nr:glycine--tRNA ligase subunit beta [Candidatus Riflebacteria bacterium]